MKNARDLFVVGMRVQMTRQAYHTFGKLQTKNNFGVVIGFNRYSNYSWEWEGVKIKRDNVKKPETYNMSFWEMQYEQF